MKLLNDEQITALKDTLKNELLNYDIELLESEKKLIDITVNATVGTIEELINRQIAAKRIIINREVNG